MEMPPDTLEAVGINELFVAVGVDASFTTEQAASGSSGTHRAISSHSNTESISSMRTPQKVNKQFSLTHGRARTIL